jgi:hypothetical protein
MKSELSADDLRKKKNRGSGSQRETAAQRERRPATTPKFAVDYSTTT